MEPLPARHEAAAWRRADDCSVGEMSAESRVTVCSPVDLVNMVAYNLACIEVTWQNRWKYDIACCERLMDQGTVDPLFGSFGL